MQVRWTAEARSDLVRLYEFLAPMNRTVAVRIVKSLQAAPGRLRNHPRLGSRLDRYALREVRRLIIEDYELRYEVTARTIFVLNLWHTCEDR